LNPAPVRIIPDQSVLWKSTVFVVNQIEAEFYSGIPVHTAQDAVEAGAAVLRRGIDTVVVTRGDKGSVLVLHDLQETVQAFSADPVDTTAAGDTYIGGFCTEWLRTGDVVSAMRYGSAAAAISVTRFGAQTSIPADTEVRSF
jgi:ribokinase